LFAVGLGTFMSALDSSIVNTVLPVIRHSFGADVATVEWVITIYLLVISGLLLPFGRLGDMRGQKNVYALGFAAFVVASAMCGLAPSPATLVAFRGLQAIGAAMLFANGPAIITKNVSSARRGQALGLVSTMTYLGLTAGPPLGGILAGVLGWRSVFYINVPIGLAGLAATWFLVPPDAAVAEGERFDLAGASLFLGGLVLLMLALNQGYAWGWLSPVILGSFAAAVVLLAAFVIVEGRVVCPMLDLSLFGERVLSAAMAGAVVNYIVIYTVVFLMPFYLIQGRGLSPARAGLLLAVQAITMAIVAPISGTMSDRIGSRVPTMLGMGVLAAGLLLLSRLGAATPVVYMAGALFVTGLGPGMFVAANTSALMGAAPRHRQGIAAGVLAEARNVGMVLGVGFSGAILTTVVARSPEAHAGLFAGVSTSFTAAAAVAAVGVGIASQISASATTDA
jgi:EmrB/QacA subfamily drug resistance transporter